MSVLRPLRYAVALMSLLLVRPLWAGCQAQITMTKDGTSGVKAMLFGMGNCFSPGNNGGPVGLFLKKNDGPFVGVKNCPDGPCTLEVGQAFSCGNLQQWELAVQCNKTVEEGMACAPDDAGMGRGSVKLDHQNALTAGEAAGSISGRLNVHAPDAWTDRVIQYTLLRNDGTVVPGGSQPVGDPQHDDTEVSYAVPAGPEGGSLKATLISCGDTRATTVIDAGGDHQCDDCSPNRPPQCQDCVGGPIRLQNGNMRYSEADPLPSIGGVAMKRTYDSGGPSLTWFGAGWSSIFDRALYVYPPFDEGTYVMIWLDGTKRYIFRQLAGTFFVQMWPLGSQHATLTTDEVTGAYTLREPARDIEVVIEPQSGLPVRYLSRSTGRSLSISYEGTTPTHVTDSWGNFAWTVNTSGHRVDSISVDGTALNWEYVYNGAILSSVKGPGGVTWRSYTYQGNSLTDVHEAAGKLIESHAYDGFGRASSSLQSEGDITGINYIAPGSSLERIAKVFSASGAVTEYHVRYFGGRGRTVQIDGNCPTCGANDAVFAYTPASYGEAGGQLRRMQDARGYVTDYTHDGADRVILLRRGFKPLGCDPETDPSRCRQNSETLFTVELEATSATDTTAYDYFEDQDAVVWTDRPSRIARTSVANPGASVIETFTYEPVTGTVVSHAVSGYVGTELETHLTTTALYAGEPAAFDPGGAFSAAWLTLPQPSGFRKSTDGPREDVSDLTEWVYYPIDAAVPGPWRGRLAAVRDAANNVTRYESYDVLGNPLRVVDPNGVATELTYDALGRVLTSTLKAVAGCDTAADPLCATDLVTTRTYHSTFGSLATEQRPGGGTSSYEYDARGRLSAVTRAVTAALSERVEYDFDPGTGKKSAERYFSGQSGSWTEARSEEFGYDAFARLVTVDHPGGASLVYAYDGMNNITSVEDENHAAPNTIYKYDAVGRLIQVTQILASTSFTTHYEYDLHGNLTKVIDPNGNETTYTFDDFGRMRSQVSPVSGTTTYDYDPAGNLTTTTDANGATTARTYDALGRVTSAVSTKGTESETVTWEYDGTAPFSRGRLRTMTDPSGATVYDYERRGLLRAEAKTILGATYTTTFGHDADGNRSTMTYPSGRVVAYGVDLTGRPTSAVSGSTTLVNSAAYKPFGPLTELVYGNGMTKTMQYDARYRVTENKLTGPGGVIADYVYAQDAAGNITQIHDAVDPTYNRDFAYDDLGRLTTAATGPSLWGTGAYAYDAMGNLLSRTLGTPPPPDGGELSLRRPKSATVMGYVETMTFAYDGTTPKIVTVTTNGLDHTVTYDAAGNETQYHLGRIYSPRNLLTAVEDAGEETPHRIDYGYDGRGIRVSRTESPNGPLPAQRVYIYSPELQLLAVTVDEPANVWASHVPRVLTAPLPPNREIIWFAGRPVAEVGPPRTAAVVGDLSVSRRPKPLAATDIFYTFTDHLDTPILQTDAAAQVVWRAEYEPYGNVWTMRAGSRTDQPLRFPGQELAMTWEGGEESYNIFRWYKSGWGRYTQGDPIGLRGGLNLFAYVDDNPTNWSDPRGLKVFRCCRDIEVNVVMDGVARLMGFKHCFLKTDSIEAGMGPADNGPLPTCPIGVQTAVTNHKGQSQSTGTQCTEFKDVDEKCVNDELGVGRALGRWAPWNQCNSFTDDVLRRCKKCSPQPPSPPGDTGKRYF